MYPFLLLLPLQSIKVEQFKQYVFHDMVNSWVVKKLFEVFSQAEKEDDLTFRVINLIVEMSCLLGIQNRNRFD